VKTFLRQPHQRRSGYVALMVFLLAYTAIMAFVISPEQVKSAMDTSWNWPFE
jgi:hypothetical protein